MWLKLHTELEHHPKLLKLQSLTKWDSATTIGKVITLWFWVAQYAEDGDLRSHGLGTINRLLGLRSRDRVLIHSKFVDSYPYLRIHDWWDYFGLYLQMKYRRSEEKWHQIRDLYDPKLYSVQAVVHDRVRTVTASSTASSKSITSIASEHKRASEASLHQERGTARSAEATRLPAQEPVIKSYEDAKGDELCGPPPDMLKMLKNSLKK